MAAPNRRPLLRLALILAALLVVAIVVLFLSDGGGIFDYDTF